MHGTVGFELVFDCHIFRNLIVLYVRERARARVSVHPSITTFSYHHVQLQPIVLEFERLDSRLIQGWHQESEFFLFPNSMNLFMKSADWALVSIFTAEVSRIVPSLLDIKLVNVSFRKRKRAQCLRTGLLNVLLCTPCKWLASLTKLHSNYTNKITILLHILGKGKGDLAGSALGRDICS